MKTTHHDLDMVTLDLLTDLIARVEYLTARAEGISSGRISRKPSSTQRDRERSISSLLLELHGIHAQLGAALANLERRELKKLL